MVRQIIRSISHKHTDFKYQCIDQGNLVEFLGPFQHDISFKQYFAAVYNSISFPICQYVFLNFVWSFQLKTDFNKKKFRDLRI
jgi:hypothetical protein